MKHASPLEVRMEIRIYSFLLRHRELWVSQPVGWMWTQNSTSGSPCSCRSGSLCTCPGEEAVCSLGAAEPQAVSLLPGLCIRGQWAGLHCLSLPEVYRGSLPGLVTDTPLLFAMLRAHSPSHWRLFPDSLQCQRLPSRGFCRDKEGLPKSQLCDSIRRLCSSPLIELI